MKKSSFFTRIVFSVTKRGSIITNEGVVSYNQNEKKRKLIIKKLNFEEISDIKTSNDFDRYTLIKVIDKSGDVINLFITNKNNKEKGIN